MALKDLLVHVDQTERAGVRLRLAADLAKCHGSRLTAICVRELDPDQLHAQSIAELGLASADAVAAANLRIRRALMEGAGRVQALVEEVGREYGIEIEWRCLDGVASTLVPQHARFADLCVLSQDAPIAASAPGYSFSEQLLFVTGRPVIFVPSHGAFSTVGRHVLVAWNSSRASARAVNDALPIIERAEKVTVVAANATEFAARYAALPPQNMLEHLRRHGVEPNGIWLDKVPTASIAAAVLSKAHEVGADLIVAGAFGHPKLWEKIMGGVTCDLLSRMSVPVLMSY